MLPFANIEHTLKGLKPLHLAIRRQRFDIALDLVKAGASVNVMDEGVGSPLYAASALNKMDLVDALLGANADTELYIVGNDVGKAPILAAVMANNIEVAQKLLEAGANPNARNSEGQSAQLLAILRWNLKMSALLQEGGGKLTLLVSFRTSTSL